MSRVKRMCSAGHFARVVGPGRAPYTQGMPWLGAKRAGNRLGLVACLAAAAFLGFTAWPSVEAARASVGQVTEFSAAQANAITSGPDGNMWLAQYSAADVSEIGRITPSGTVTEFPLPDAAAVPNAITTGPDGNLWFTELDGNKIGRITQSGTITEVTDQKAGRPSRKVGASATPERA
jgi:streptogramin lyase